MKPLLYYLGLHRHYLVGLEWTCAAATSRGLRDIDAVAALQLGNRIYDASLPRCGKCKVVNDVHSPANGGRHDVAGLSVVQSPCKAAVVEFISAIQASMLYAYGQLQRGSRESSVLLARWFGRMLLA